MFVQFSEVIKGDVRRRDESVFDRLLDRFCRLMRNGDVGGVLFCFFLRWCYCLMNLCLVLCGSVVCS